MNVIEIKIPKEVRQHKETIFFGLSARQFICAVHGPWVLPSGSTLGHGPDPVLSKEAASAGCVCSPPPRWPLPDFSVITA
ncbi:MAG: PrgI family protein [Oscillospiraceae bacterium]